MGPPDPPLDFFATHLVYWDVPQLISLAPLGLIKDNGTAFMSQYLVHPTSLPDMMPSLLVQLGGVPYEQRSVQLVGNSLHASSIYGLGSNSCVPVGSALQAPVLQDTTSAGPYCPDPEKIYLGRTYQMGLTWWQTRTLLFVNGGHFCSLSSLCPLADPTFLVPGVLVGDPRIQKRI